MSLNNIRKDLEELFETGWNVPADGEIDKDGTKELRNAPFVRMEILPGQSINTGTRGCVDRTGAFSIMIFIIADRGLGEGWDKSSKVALILENKRINNTILYETSVYNRGRIKGSNVHLFEATTFYTSEETP